MFNRTWLATILFLLFCNLQAQDTLRMSFGLETSLARQEIFNAAYYESLTFRFGRHRVLAGVAIAYENGNPAPRQGLQAGYLYQPEKKKGRFRLQTGLQSSFFSFERPAVEGRGFNRSDPWPEKGTVKIKALDSFGCFGFRWNFHRAAYFRMMYGLGITFYSADYSITLVNGTTLSADGPMELRPLSLNNRLLQFCLGLDLVNFSRSRKN